MCPLSASTRTRRTGETAEGTGAQLLERTNAAPGYAIQVDESAEGGNRATMLVFVPNVFRGMRMGTGCALLLPASPTAADLFRSFNDYTSGKLNCSLCVHICADGAAAVTRRHSRFTTRVKEAASECESRHCVTHREMPASQKVPPELINVLQDGIKIISWVKTHTLNSRLFAQLCGWTQSTRVLSHTQR